MRQTIQPSRPRRSSPFALSLWKTAPCSAARGFADVASVTADPPPVITLGAANTISDIWDLEGTVTDNGKPVAGLKVKFGGVLSKYHLTATVEENGTYSVTEELRNITRGTATAQTRAQDGKASNVAMTYIVNNHLSRRASRQLRLCRLVLRSQRPDYGQPDPTRLHDRRPSPATRAMAKWPPTPR